MIQCLLAETALFALFVVLVLLASVAEMVRRRQTAAAEDGFAVFLAASEAVLGFMLDVPVLQRLAVGALLFVVHLHVTRFCAVRLFAFRTRSDGGIALDHELVLHLLHFFLHSNA